jgi:predicted ArsR family transcriptional regulator
MPRNRPLVRSWQLAALLRSASNGLTLDELAQELGVTTRTVRRDLDALEEAYVAIVKDRDVIGGPTRWAMIKHGRCPICRRSETASSGDAVRRRGDQLV